MFCTSHTRTHTHALSLSLTQTHTHTHSRVEEGRDQVYVHYKGASPEDDEWIDLVHQRIRYCQIYIYIFTHMYIQTHTHTHTHTYMYIYVMDRIVSVIYIYIPVSAQPSVSLQEIRKLLSSCTHSPNFAPAHLFRPPLFLSHRYGQV